ncbi:hypothetical protein ETD86_29540 [Nonomuraea turkmeniaca]|uniref:Uncharacterized protein n=1 Tax=Nonomuraea turkmeniaca TaxID=103838 RepID=A0A5S4FB95_9ACTN|nr:hypothetical protein [Nonomuraea turkmeniaca]TMR14091.1 hypothetical protein ETD86_29540 [Nonomuraea turkmeniaca]
MIVPETPKNMSPCWVLYARSGNAGAVRAHLAELRAFVDGEADGRTVAECSDVGEPGPGLEAALALLQAGVASQVAVKGMRAFGWQEEHVASVIVRIGEAGAGLAVLDDIRQVASPVPEDLSQQVRDVFASAGVGPDHLGDVAPLWYYDGGLSVARGYLHAAHARLGKAEAGTPPGFGVPAEMMRARIEAARAERVFAETLLEAVKEQG